jgi:hypothetical protein
MEDEFLKEHLLAIIVMMSFRFAREGERRREKER